jgi:hypothetical protein
MLNTREEQVITAYGKDTQEALLNAIKSVNLDELDHLTVSNGAYVDNYGQIYDGLPKQYQNSTLLHVGGGIPIVIANADIYIDEIEPTRETVEIKRGDLVEFSVQTPYHKYNGGGVAWRRFENQHGRGWVLLHQNNPTQNMTVYDANIYAVERVTVEYDEQTRELFRTVWNDEEAGA